MHTNLTLNEPRAQNSHFVQWHTSPNRCKGSSGMSVRELTTVALIQMRNNGYKYIISAGMLSQGNFWYTTTSIAFETTHKDSDNGQASH